MKKFENSKSVMIQCTSYNAFKVVAVASFSALEVIHFQSSNSLYNVYQLILTKSSFVFM